MTPTKEILKDENGFQRNKLSVLYEGVTWSIEKCGPSCDWTDMRGELSILVNTMTGRWINWGADEGGY